MAANFSVAKILGLVIIIVMLLALSLPMIETAFTTTNSSGTNSTQYRGISNVIAQYVGQYNTTGTNASNQIQGGYLGHVFNLTNNYVYAANTSSSSTPVLGFFSNIAQLTGLGFVFGAIGYIIQTVSLLGSIGSVLFGTLFGFLPNVVGFSISAGGKLVVFYVEMRYIFVGISAWSKYDLWSS